MRFLSESLRMRFFNLYFYTICEMKAFRFWIFLDRPFRCINLSSKVLTQLLICGNEYLPSELNRNVLE